MVNERKPHFLEVFLPSLSSDRLKIPPKFVKFLECRTTGSVSLTGPSGSSWHVNLIENNGHLFFDDGWSSFVKDHSIGCGDSIVFAYNGNLDFSVLIFDQTSCEKEESFYAKSSQECSDLNRNLMMKRESEEEAVFGFFSKKRKKGSFIPVHLDLKDTNEIGDLTTACKSQEDEGTERSVEERSERLVVLGLASVGNDENMPSRRSIMPNLETFFSKKRKTATENKTDISKFVEEKAAQYFSSIFPYFVRLMKYSHVNDRSSLTLKIPVRFSMEHLPNCKIEITIRNLSGGSWVVNAVPTSKNHTRFHTLSRGWSSFVRDNKIKEKDVCIFELVDKFEMHIHVLRLGLDGVDSKTPKSANDAYGVGLVESPPKIVDQDNFVPQKTLEMTNEAITNNDNGSKKDSEMILGSHQEVSSFVDHDNFVPQKTSEMANEAITNNDNNSKKDSEMILGSHQEVSSFGHTCDAVMTGPVTIASTPISETHGKITDQLLGCSGEVTTSYKKSGESQTDLHGRHTTNRPVIGKDVGAAMYFRSSFPHFTKVIHCSNVGGSFTLDVPRKFSAAYLPTYRKEIVLRNEEGVCWKVMSARYGLQTKLCGGWMTFVRQNHLEVGDICIFELVEESILQVHLFQANQGMQKFPRSDIVDDYSSTCVET